MPRITSLQLFDETMSDSCDNIAEKMPKNTQKTDSRNDKIFPALRHPLTARDSAPCACAHGKVNANLAAALEPLGLHFTAQLESTTPEKGLRYELFKSHPTAAECALASERFNERLVLSERVAHLAAPESHLQ